MFECLNNRDELFSSLFLFSTETKFLDFRRDINSKSDLNGRREQKNAIDSDDFFFFSRSVSSYRIDYHENIISFMPKRRAKALSTLSLRLSSSLIVSALFQLLLFRLFLPSFFL